MELDSRPRLSISSAARKVCVERALLPQVLTLDLRNLDLNNPLSIAQTSQFPSIPLIPHQIYSRRPCPNTHRHLIY